MTYRKHKRFNVKMYLETKGAVDLEEMDCSPLEFARRKAV